MSEQTAKTRWSDLEFFARKLPDLQRQLEADPRVVYPPRRWVFRAFDLCPPDETRVVILGQDPYHTAGKADGLAFSIPQDFGGRLGSLGNIFRELQDDLGKPRSRTDLSDWARQGVLLLNTALTVPQGVAGGHARLGWHFLTREVLAHLSARPRAFLLWGRHAQQFATSIHGNDHFIIRTAHPSPLSAHRGFLGSRPFSRINAWLKARGDKPIHWTDP